MFLALIIGAGILLSSTPLQAPARFAAEVFRGQDSEREFGPGLIFRLRASRDPRTPGWTIEVRPRGESTPEVEFSWVATPPYRFFNPRYLEVSYGYSAEQIVQINPREFRFVRNRAGYELASEAVRKLLWPSGITPEELERAEKTLADLETCRGILRILDSRISAAGGTESIDWLNFELELCS
jgi:hypothetical protein